MKPIEVQVEVPAGATAVWADLADVGSHAEWMTDAHSIEFLTDRQSGVGTRMAVETRVGPLRTTDIMEFTAWEPPRRMAVAHAGLFTGTGEFLLEPIDDRSTRFTWRETIRFPWFLGGPLGAVAAQPILTAIWRRNLKRFAERF